jgi:hypothetical protein
MREEMLIVVAILQVLVSILVWLVSRKLIKGYVAIRRPDGGMFIIDVYTTNPEQNGPQQQQNGAAGPPAGPPPAAPRHGPP